MNNKIAVIAADYPNFISGYSGYNFNLVNSLRENGVKVFLFTSNDKLIQETSQIIKVKWSLSGILKIIKHLRIKDIKVVNIQYPNLLYGRFNLIPNLLAVILRLNGFKITTTIHEYSNINFLRRIFQFIFFITSKKIIVTTEQEKKKLQKEYNPLLKNRICLIRIGSNIKAINTKSNFRSRTIIYFGMFYPGKKLKESLKAMKEVELHFPNEFRFKIIGTTHKLFPAYYEECFNYSKSNLKNIEWLIGITDEEIEEQVKNTFCAFLYFNDGASLRRGSLLACLVNGIPVFSNKGSYSLELSTFENKGLFYFEDKNSLLKKINELKDDEKLYSECFENLKKYSDKFNFTEVAKNYKKLLFEPIQEEFSQEKQIRS